MLSKKSFYLAPDDLADDHRLRRVAEALDLTIGDTTTALFRLLGLTRRKYRDGHLRGLADAELGQCLFVGEDIMPCPKQAREQMRERVVAAFVKVGFLGRAEEDEGGHLLVNAWGQMCPMAPALQAAHDARRKGLRRRLKLKPGARLPTKLLELVTAIEETERQAQGGPSPEMLSEHSQRLERRLAYRERNNDRRRSPAEVVPRRAAPCRAVPRRCRKWCRAARL